MGSLNIKWKPLIVSLLISLGVGIVSALITSGSMDVYDTVYKPPLAPPAWLFPIAWTLLYILMGVAAYLVYVSDADDTSKKMALFVYGVQLLVNGLWPVIFFSFELFPLAFAWIILLWYLVYLTYQRFSGINKLAGWLLIPYLAWLTFAAYLSLMIAINE
jgi:tryptophan-rich sensory protein